MTNNLSSDYATLTATDLDFFRHTLSPERVLTDSEHLLRCASDHTEDLQYLPQAVLQPLTTQEVSLLMHYCYQHRIAVTTRGAGTGLSGGCLPLMGGIVLDMKRMDQIEHIDTDNFQVTTQPGVITEVLQQAVQEKGLFYPVDPASRGSCFIGGNIAENSGGPRALKYGVVKDYVLNLEIVLADGRTMWTGANTLKNATGYNLTQLIVGSEGTLAVVTRIVLRLLPHPQKDMLILVPFRSTAVAAAAVNLIFMAGYQPSALEFMERDAIICAQQFLGKEHIPLPEDIAAHLLIEVDGNEESLLMQQIEGIATVLEACDTGDILMADTQEQKAALWALRRSVGEAVKMSSVYKEEDTVVPRAALPQLLQKVKDLGKHYGFSSVCYGHAGDGNLHVNILKGDLSTEAWTSGLEPAIRELFSFVHQLGGTISGEHGIGLVQKKYMDIVFDQTGMDLMKGIKAVFDPKGILNPGKIFDFTPQ